LLTPYASDDVIIVGERSLVDSVRAMTKKSDEMYNLKFHKSGVKDPTPIPSDVNTSQSFSIRARDSTMGGKMPIHGPRRLTKPGPLFQGDYVIDSKSSKFRVLNQK